MGADQQYEFMGPVLGPMAVMVGLPAVCYGLVYACNAEGCFSVRSLSVPGLPPQTQLISTKAFVAILGWMAFQMVLHLCMPGKYIQGTLLANGKRLTYKVNGKCISCCVVPKASATS